MTTLQLTNLWIYPIKSCAGQAVPAVHVTPQSGLAGDREWVLLTPDGRQAWMGEFHRMTLIRAQLDSGELVLNAPGLEPIRVPLDVSGQPCNVKMWNDIRKVMEVFPGVDAGARASEWIEAAIGQPLRLVRLGREAIERDALLPLHVVSLASWRELNRRLGLLGDPAVELERFRANLVIDGHSMQPFSEEAFSRITWHGDDPPVVMAMSGNCVRCVMPNIDLASAEAGRQPLALTAAMSKERGLRVPSFGVNGGVIASGHLLQGMHGHASVRED